MRVAALVGLALALAACGAGEPSRGSSSPLSAEERADEPGATRASREAAAPAENPGPAPAAAPAEDRPLVALVTIEAAEGEDGAGNVVPAARPLAVDLDAHAFPPRALDPVLTIGALRFVHYTHPRPGVLRFVIADATALAPGSEVAVQYGDDAASRRVVMQALALPASGPAAEVSP